MHSLLTALGSYGDVHPMVGLGVAMRRRGHEVQVVTNPHFADVVRDAGLEFVGVGEADDYEQITWNESLWKPVRGMQFVFRNTIGFLEELHQTLQRLYRPGESVIGAHGLDLASRLLAETHGAPVVSASFAPFSILSWRSPPRLPTGLSGRWAPRWALQGQLALGDRLVFRPHLVRPFDKYRRAMGLAPLGKEFWNWYYGGAPPLCLFPEWYAPPPGDWPEGTVTTTFPLWDGGEVNELSAEAREFLEAGSPPVVFMPGSANRDAADFFAAATDACRLLNRRGVLLTKYPEQLPRESPEGVRWLGFPPLGRVLDRAAAFVHHGGIGSSARGLAAGIPQLVRPLGFDQFDNSQRLRRLGVAEELAGRRFRGPAVAEALGRLLASSEVAAAARRCADRLRQEGLDHACEVLERRLQAAGDQ